MPKAALHIRYNTVCLLNEEPRTTARRSYLEYSFGDAAMADCRCRPSVEQPRKRAKLKMERKLKEGQHGASMINLSEHG